jgi:hypothetical protein
LAKSNFSRKPETGFSIVEVMVTGLLTSARRARAALRHRNDDECVGKKFDDHDDAGRAEDRQLRAAVRSTARGLPVQDTRPTLQ